MRHQAWQHLSTGHPVAVGAIGFGIFDEIRIAIFQAPILEAHVGLFPADHAVAAVVEDQHGEVEAEANRGLHLLAVHHEAAVAADRHHLAIRIDHVRRHRAGQACPHRGQRVIKQHGVGVIGGVVAGEPDLVDAIVERDDAIVRHHLPDLAHQILRVDREARIRHRGVTVGHFGGTRSQHGGKIPVRLDTDRLFQLPHRIGDIADHLDLREIYRVHLRRTETHVDHGGRIARHEEGRFFNHIVTDIDDHVRPANRSMDEIPGRKRRTTE